MKKKHTGFHQIIRLIDNEIIAKINTNAPKGEKNRKNTEKRERENNYCVFFYNFLLIILCFFFFFEIARSVHVKM